MAASCTFPRCASRFGFGHSCPSAPVRCSFCGSFGKERLVPCTRPPSRLWRPAALRPVSSFRRCGSCSSACFSSSCPRPSAPPRPPTSSRRPAMTTIAGTQAAPFKTIQAALNNACTGDTVTLAAGTYTGPGDVDLDMSGKSITVTSASGKPMRSTSIPMRLTPPPQSFTQPPPRLRPGTQPGAVHPSRTVSQSRVCSHGLRHSHYHACLSRPQYGHRPERKGNRHCTLHSAAHSCAACPRPSRAACTAAGTSRSGRTPRRCRCAVQPSPTCTFSPNPILASGRRPATVTAKVRRHRAPHRA